MDKAVAAIANLYHNGNEIVVTHGNGPQVGMLATFQKESLAVLTAQTQAWIGMEIERRLSVALKKKEKRLDYSVSEVVLTRTIVDRNSAAFRNPSKPIGKFYTKGEADVLSSKGYVMKKVINGYRRIVPSPEPKQIIESKMIRQMMDKGKIVIGCGGGGIAVCKTRYGFDYAEAVIDKDLASSLLAVELKADRFIVLTNVDGAYLNFRKRNQELIGRISAREMELHLKRGHFEDGSMKPKVEACISFVKETGNPAGIGNILHPENVLSFRKLTLII